MTKPFLLSLTLLAVAAGGCELLNPMGDGGADDMAAGPDADLTAGPDFAGDPNSMTLMWTMWDSMRSGHFTTCDDPMAGVTSITFTAQDQATKQMVSTTVPCPAGVDRNEATIKLTASTGFFDLTAVTNGNAIGYGSVSGARPVDSVNLNIYLFGWDMYDR